jgi:hypothetical protein
MKRIATGLRALAFVAVDAPGVAAASPTAALPQVGNSMVYSNDSETGIIVLIPAPSVKDKVRYDPAPDLAKLASSKTPFGPGTAVAAASGSPDADCNSNYGTIANTKYIYPAGGYIKTSFTDRAWIHVNSLPFGGFADRMCLDGTSSTGWYGALPYYANLIGLEDQWYASGIMVSGGTINGKTAGANIETVSGGIGYNPPYIDGNAYKTWYVNHKVYDIEITAGGLTGYHIRAYSSMFITNTWYYSNAKADCC